jgi:hypothetical protein
MASRRLVGLGLHALGRPTHAATRCDPAIPFDF